MLFSIPRNLDFLGNITVFYAFMLSLFYLLAPFSLFVDLLEKDLSRKERPDSKFY